MIFAVYGCERSGTNLLSWVLSDLGAEVADAGAWKHEAEMVRGDVPVFIVKHPVSWVHSIYRHGWRYPWMQEGHYHDTIQEFAARHDVVNHWVKRHERWLQQTQRFARYEDLISDASGAALRNLPVHCPGPLRLPGGRMGFNNDPTDYPFDVTYYREERWRTNAAKDILGAIPPGLLDRLGYIT